MESLCSAHFSGGRPSEIGFALHGAGTRVFVRGILKVRRGRKPAENAAQRKNSHLWMETNQGAVCNQYLSIGKGIDKILIVREKNNPMPVFKGIS